MSKPGDVIAFKPGHFGLESPRNLGVLVKRNRRKGVPWVEIVTLEGRQEMKADHVLKRAFKQRYEGKLDDTAEVMARLKFLVTQHESGSLEEQAADDLDVLQDELWNVCNDGLVRTDEEIAKVFYGEVSPQQLRDVRAALDGCRRPGHGRFETVDRGNEWRACTADELESMRTAWQALGALRSKLIVVEETEEGRQFTRRALDDAHLDAQDQATLAWATAAMVQFIEHDGVPDKVICGLAGLPVVNAFGMDLHRTLGFLAQDWIRSEHTTRSSDYVHFLIESATWTPVAAVASLTRRHVNQEPFFEHVADAEAEELAAELPEPAMDGRTDLRSLDCFTIDPPDARDFDDAVGLESIDGGQRLWVHIADVSHYVQIGTMLDRHAKKRATSVYLPGQVLPMLPARIADHLCSLRDDGDRFAMSVAMDIKDGHIVATDFKHSLIRVNQNLSYNDALERRDAGDADMLALFALAASMQVHREGLRIETGELRVQVADAFEAEVKHGNDATRMIEAFMVAANEAVAKHLADNGQPLLYRCHPMPDAAKADRYSHQLETMGLDVPFDLPKAKGSEGGGQSLLEALKAGGGKMDFFGGGMDLPPVVEEKPEETKGFAALSDDERAAWLAPFKAALQALETLGSARAEVATQKLLACMGQAYYTPENEGHFGLASTHYCHFTSPIRRYPDLVVHRNLKWLIYDKKGTLPHAQEDLQRLCDHCSEQERAASKLERRIKDACLVLASLHGDGAFSQAPGRVTGMTPTSLFVKMDNGIEARVKGRDLPGGPYAVDEWESMLFVSDQQAPERFSPEELAKLGTWHDEEMGETRRIRALLGDTISCRLAGRDVAAGKTGAEIVAWK